MIYASAMRKINFYIFVCCCLFLITIKGMEQQAQSSDLFELPIECKVRVLGFLYTPDEKPGARHIIRFLRTAKKYYNSDELASHLIYMMQSKKRHEVYSDLNALFALGTPTAVNAFKNQLNSTKDMWRIHFLFGHMLALGDTRSASILRALGADLNADFRGLDEHSVFLELVRHFYPDAKMIEKFLKAGANINSVDAYGSNILMHIIRDLEEKRALPVAKLLIQKGIDVNHPTVAGRSAVAIAHMAGKLLIKAEIEKAGGQYRS